VVEEMQAFGIEAKVAGIITKTPGVTLVSRGTESAGQTLSFEI
jgi:hypothetical protein